MLQRSVNILNSNSFFLFGARGTGKTTLIQRFLFEKSHIKIDLLDERTYESLSLNIGELDSILLDAEKNNIEWVAIDEIQKLPKLLDTVHKYIERKKIKFALTGSSARKLKRGGANLLAGRAFTYDLFPLTHKELRATFDLDKAMSWGTLPKSYLSETDEERAMFLQSYVNTYIKEEILVEQIIRKIEPFRRFLSIAAQESGNIINYENISKDVKASAVTVKSYFQILEDTLIGFFLEPFHESVRKRQKSNPKFYLFDLGVKRALSKQLTLQLQPKTFDYGVAFEHFIISEIKRICSYCRNDYEFFYLKTKDDAEIDLIIDRPGKQRVLIEIKSTNLVRDSDVRTVSRFVKDMKNTVAYCLSNDPTPKEVNDVKCRFWKDGIDEILNV